MIIGIDIDSTICNTTEAVLQVHKENTGENLSIEDIKSYSIEKYVSKEYRKDFYKIFLDKRVWKRIELIDGCVKYIEMLSKEHDIYFVTSTELTNLVKKEKYLQRNFPFLNIRKKIIGIHNKQLLSGLDVLIDDCLENLIGGDYKKIVLDYAWNRDIDDKENGLVRCKSWEEIYKVINEEVNRR